MLFFQGIFSTEATKQNQLLGRNLLLVEPCGNIFSKIFYHFSFISNVKKYDYPRVTQTVSSFLIGKMKSQELLTSLIISQVIYNL